ncbi:unnamed protein product [Adineta steineri]|uniref:SAM domain-containing protein n=2 Tax=Adineta steineri TaxID=433720 RepID=A0A819Q1T4_9BILA|nr:unnamed protein product [Adineta steineri]CAF4017822.1 unnamed protein product [Adineta steineri]
MTSDTSFWLKFLQESDLSVNNQTLLRYATALTDRFATLEELLNVGEDELRKLGITNQFDRACLIRQAQLFDERENLPLTRQSTDSSCNMDHWLGIKQSTPLNPQSKCSLSPALLSRISFNDHSSYNESTIINEKYPDEHTIIQVLQTPKRIQTINSNDKIKTLLDSCSKIVSPSPSHGMRPIKSLSDTIALQKKILVGNDRLKRLSIPKSLLKRQTAIITKKVSNITNKLINPFAKMTHKNDPKPVDTNKITSNEIVIANAMKRIPKNDEQECLKVQLLTLDDELRRSTNLLHQNDEIESKHNGQTLPSKRFKLGATTTFLTRSIANHGS